MDKLAQKVKERIKGETIALLLEDDEAFHETLKQVVHEAMIQPRRVPNGPYNYTQKDSPVIEAARVAATTLVSDLISEMLEHPEIKTKLYDALLFSMPWAMQNVWDNKYRLLMDDTLREVRVELNK